MKRFKTVRPASLPGFGSEMILGAYPSDPRIGVYAANQPTGPEVSIESDSAPVSLLDRKHPEYLLKIDAWIDLKLLSDGGVSMKSKAERLLMMRPREDAEVFAARKQRFTYQNILGTALGWYSAAMYQDDPQFFFYRDNSRQKEVPKEKLEYYTTTFLSDCDNNRTGFVDFTKRMFLDMLTYGSAYVLTDLPPQDPDKLPLNALQEEQMGYKKPFLVAYNPMEVINWKLDRFGGYEWVVIKTTNQEQSFLGKGEVVDTWYYFDKTRYQTYEYRRSIDSLTMPQDAASQRAKLIDRGTHALSNVGRVPLRCLQFSNDLWVANRAYLLLMDHLNTDNAYSWALFMSNLAIPVIIGDADASNMVGTEVGYYQFPAGTEYKWSEPEGRSFVASATRLESLREEAFRCMYLQQQGMSSNATPQMQSGRSKLVSMVPTREVLSGMGNDYRQRLQEILTDVKDARRDVEIQPDVRGFDYEEDMSTEQVFAVSSLLAMRVPSEKFERWIYKKIVKAWARDVNQKLLEDMYKEIDNGPTIEDRLDEDLKNRMALAKAGMSKALSGKGPAGGAPKPPPGQGGGDGPSPQPILGEV